LAATEAEKFGTLLYLSPNLLDVSAAWTRVRPIAGLTLLLVSRPQLSAGRLFFKNVFDRRAAGIALILLSPLMLGIAAAIRLSDKEPSLFTQVRVGKDGRVFRLYKYRTMVVDAEQRLSQLMASSEIDGVLFKLRRDPRVTDIGVRLRRWSLDELPSFFNVLRGDMSLVRPRPALPSEAATYAYHVRRRLVVKPGITGLWQVNGRSDLSWEESVRLLTRPVRCSRHRSWPGSAGGGVRDQVPASKKRGCDAARVEGSPDLLE
jgi:lipopolysaccharide/colanic/teichoic acid biosynthesis glycosyltransferase